MRKLILLPILILCFISCDKDEFHNETPQQKEVQQPMLGDESKVPSNIENNNETNALKRGEEEVVEDVLMEYVNIVALSDIYNDFVDYHYDMMLADPEYVIPVEDVNWLISQFPKFEILFNEFQNLGLTYEEFLVIANNIEHKGETGMSLFKVSGEPEGDGCWICSDNACAFSLVLDDAIPGLGWLGEQVHCD